MDTEVKSGALTQCYTVSELYRRILLVFRVLVNKNGTQYHEDCVQWRPSWLVSATMTASLAFDCPSTVKVALLPPPPRPPLQSLLLLGHVLWLEVDRKGS
jgi:hypothetical protein